MSDATARIPVSMRLPAQVAHQVNSYARKAKLRKTDAYLYFIQKGIEAEQENTKDSRLLTMENRLSEILSLLKTASNVAADANAPTVEQVQEAVLRTASNFPAIRKVYLFGSIARGTAGKQSDIDLRIEIDRKLGFNLHDLDHFCKEVEQLTGREVDAITASTIKNKSLAKAIEKERVLIYERKAN